MSRLLYLSLHNVKFIKLPFALESKCKVFYPLPKALTEGINPNV